MTEFEEKMRSMINDDAICYIIATHPQISKDYAGRLVGWVRHQSKQADDASRLRYPDNTGQ